MLKDPSKEQRKRAANYKAAFGTPAGKWVIEDLMRRHFCNSTTAVAGDPYMTSWNEGRRAAVLDIFQIVNMDLSKFKMEIKDDGR